MTTTYLLDAISQSDRRVAQATTGDTTYRVALLPEGIELYVWCLGPNGRRYSIPSGTFHDVVEMRAAYPELDALADMWVSVQ